MTTEPRSMTDTRTPDARLRRSVEDVVSRMERGELSGRNAMLSLRAALTGDADTPEPGLDWQSWARWIVSRSAVGDDQHAVYDWACAECVARYDATPVEGFVCVPHQARARLAAHPVEAPRTTCVADESSCFDEDCPKHGFDREAPHD